MYRAYKLKVRDVGAEGTGTFAGYSSVFGNVDFYGTVVDAGAFKRTIDHNDGIFPLIDFHWPDRAVGLVRVSEDKTGLLTEGALDLDIQRGQELYSGLKFGEKVADLGWDSTGGYIDRMSIGFDVVTEEKKDGITHFKELSLWEISLITKNFAANEEALVTDVRAACVGLQRVNAAIRTGAEEELRAGMAELRALLNTETEDEVDPLEDFMAETREQLNELKALLAKEGSGLSTLPAGDPSNEGSDSQQHSLLDELRLHGQRLHKTLNEER